MTTSTDGANPSTRDTRWAALVVLCTGMLMIVLDVTIVNVALPTIQSSLRFTSSGLAWVVDAYLIAFGGLLMLAGRLGDLTSKRNVFIAGLALFTVASLACGLADSPTLLVGARFVQGIGAAMTSAVILGLIVTMFPDPRERAKAIGIYGFVASGGGSIGLVCGGVLTQAISWHWIFFVNVPIGVATLVCAIRLIPADRGAGLRSGADLPGALLITGALMTLVYTIVKPAADHGWAAPITLVWLAGSALLLGAFVAREAVARNPLTPLRIFRQRNVVGANLIAFCTVAAMVGLSFLGALYLQRVHGDSPLQTGLSFLPLTLVMGTLSVRYTERLMTRFGPTGTLAPGLVLVGLGILLFTRIPVHAHFAVDLLPSMLLIGTGFGISMPGLMTVAMSAATPADAGVASGLINTTTQVGGAVGLAVMATLASSRSGHLAHAGVAHPAALVGGYHLAFLVSFGLVVAAIVVGVVLSLPQRAPAMAAEPA
jgi:EmrB/QacA subfamily drug resistance transporter